MSEELDEEEGTKVFMFAGFFTQDKKKEKEDLTEK